MLIWKWCFQGLVSLIKIPIIEWEDDVFGSDKIFLISIHLRLIFLRYIAGEVNILRHTVICEQDENRPIKDLSRLNRVKFSMRTNVNMSKDIVCKKIWQGTTMYNKLTMKRI